jgi:hypothetical protein
MPIQKRVSADANPPPTTLVEPATIAQPTESTYQIQKNLFSSIEEAMQKDRLGDLSSIGERKEYRGSAYQLKTYESLENDPLYTRFLTLNYGSFKNFLFAFQIEETQSPIFDPRYDVQADVTVITKNVYYKSSHISPMEMILEAMTGVCTVDVLNKTNNSMKLTGTLKKELILPDRAAERYNFFSPLPGNRIVMWNMVKQKWSSFYMNKLIRFIKDDSTDLE